ncbi:unnamed protein product [Rotaria socialis]|uniref:Uncharacterized protein n=1 Tax=Rotaria socialis TaxID=392032 RepID=A0A821X1D5_9BILA|nr:unnamed protein product [Rotaria socialis]
MFSLLVNIPANAKWAQNGVTIAGGNGGGNATNQLNLPHGIFVDDDQTVVIADYYNHRIMQWKNGDTTNGQVVAGGNGFSQLNEPTYLFVDRQQTVYISDNYNHRVMKWVEGAKEGIVVAGGQGKGTALTQLSHPNGIFVDTLGTLVTIERKI